jgi:hypothetical protein
MKGKSLTYSVGLQRASGEDYQGAKGGFAPLFNDLVERSGIENV